MLSLLHGPLPQSALVFCSSASRSTPLAPSGSSRTACSGGLPSASFPSDRWWRQQESIGVLLLHGARPRIPVCAFPHPGTGVCVLDVGGPALGMAVLAVAGCVSHLAAPSSWRGWRQNRHRNDSLQRHPYSVGAFLPRRIALPPSPRLGPVPACARLPRLGCRYP